MNSHRLSLCYSRVNCIYCIDTHGVNLEWFIPTSLSSICLVVSLGKKSQWWLVDIGKQSCFLSRKAGIPEALLTHMAFSREVQESVTCLNPVLITVHGYPPGNPIGGLDISSRENLPCWIWRVVGKREVVVRHGWGRNSCTCEDSHHELFNDSRKESWIQLRHRSFLLLFFICLTIWGILFILVNIRTPKAMT